ncbi:hypothetical protein LDENG_00245900 [Lucifuga dentata]|nr:hypothetical protein LDENG_00245900 [Lucifuga dentata]
MQPCSESVLCVAADLNSLWSVSQEPVVCQSGSPGSSYRAVCRTRSKDSFSVSFCGMMVLKSELKSRKSSLA